MSISKLSGSWGWAVPSHPAVTVDITHWRTDMAPAPPFFGVLGNPVPQWDLSILGWIQIRVSHTEVQGKLCSDVYGVYNWSTQKYSLVATFRSHLNPHWEPTGCWAVFQVPAHWLQHSACEVTQQFPFMGRRTILRVAAACWLFGMNYEDPQGLKMGSWEIYFDNTELSSLNDIRQGKPAPAGHASPPPTVGGSPVTPLPRLLAWTTGNCILWPTASSSVCPQQSTEGCVLFWSALSM